MNRRERHASRMMKLIAVTALVGGCSGPFPSQPLPSPIASVSLSDLNAWTTFRLVYGLRTDAAWVVRVAGDSSAIANLGAPLLPDEAQVVLDAQANADALVAPARRYGTQYQNDFVGVWIEGAVVVLGFANNIGERRAEVERLFGGKVIVQEARYTHLQLQGFKNAVERDVEWFETVGVEVMWIDIDEMANVVTVQYRAPNQGAEPQILEHFEAGNWLRLDWAGPPPWTGPLGDMEVALVDSEGRPVGFVLTLNSRDPRVHGWGPYQVPEGSWHNVGIEAVDWLIEITYVRDGQETTITRELTVAPDAPAKLTVVIDE